MSAHTRGPWGLIYRTDSESYAVYGPDGPELSHVATVHFHEDTDGETRANARLIAAAPELFEALDYCEAWFTRHCPTAPLITGDSAEHPMLTCIRAALHRAQGGS